MRSRSNNRGQQLFISNGPANGRWPLLLWLQQQLYPAVEPDQSV